MFFLDNTVVDLLKCEIPSETISNNSYENLSNLQGQFQLLDNFGNLRKNEAFKTNKHSTFVTDLTPGIYFIKMNFEGQQLTQKVVITK